MNPANDREPTELARRLLEEEPDDEAQDLSLDELSELYRALAQVQGAGALMRVVSLQDRLMVQFPEISTQRYYVALKSHTRPRDALSFVVRLDWAGPDDGPLRWRQFLARELTPVWWLLVPLFGALLTLFVWSHDVRLMGSLNRLALTSLSIFVSIFGVFVIGESKRLAGRMDLFRSGRMHEFLDVDRKMLTLALIALLLAFLNAVLLATSDQLVAVEGVLDRDRAWGPLLTAVVLVVLFDLFLAIPRYYLQRLRVMFERDAIRELLVDSNDRHSSRESQPEPEESPK